MISDLIASVFAAIVIDPIQADVTERLNNLGASVEVIQQSRECLATAGPQLLQQAVDDPWWAGTTIIGIGTGWQSPADLLASKGPSCAPVVTLLQAPASES